MTIQITGTAQKQAWVDKVMPPAEQVTPLVWSVPIALGDNPVRYTLAYLMTNAAGECIVVDPGFDSDEGWRQLGEGLALAGLTLDSVIGIVSTHFHHDHLGMVRRLADASGAWIGMHPIERDALDQRHQTNEARAADRDWLSRCGVPSDTVDSLVLTPEAIEYVAQLARPTKLLEHNDLLPLSGRRIRVLATPGHTPGHICLADEDGEVILTGDHVLPRISPHVGLGANSGSRNALAEYYDSLDLMLEWDAYEVCPAHEYRFRGLAGRATDLRDHHEERAQEIIDVLTANPTLSLWNAAEQLSWSRGWASLDGMNLRSALSETIAHVEHLAGTGRVAWGWHEDLAGAQWAITLPRDPAEDLPG